MNIYYIIISKVHSRYSGNNFEAVSDNFSNYPPDFMIKREMKKLENRGLIVHSARVEKRYELSE